VVLTQYVSLFCGVVRAVTCVFFFVVLFQQDPFVVVSLQDKSTFKWVVLGRTETARDCHTTGFSMSFSVPFAFECVQLLRLEVYDENAQGDARLEMHDFVGFVEVTVGEILACGGSRKSSLKNESPNSKLKRAAGIHGLGEIAVRLEQVNLTARPADLTFHFCGRALDKKDLFGKSDPYLIICRENVGGGWTVVHKTEIVMKNRNPTWKPFTLSLEQLCNGHRMRRLQFEVFDWDAVGGHDLIGICVTSIAEIEEKWKSQKPLVAFELSNAGKKKKKGYKNSGYVDLHAFSDTPVFAFSDFLVGGLQMNLCIAVDFTASNRDAECTSSLHYIGKEGSGQFNEYQAAIRAVGDVLAFYDFDKRFPSFGFGAKLVYDDMKLSHCFPLNKDPNAPEIFSIDGVLACYSKCLRDLSFSGPTLFEPVIRRAMSICKAAPCTQANQNFLVLLILTDGDIMDLQETKTAIVEASHLPMSIVIVGVGKESFKLLVELDSDDKLLTDNRGRVAEADIVQFVPFARFAGQHNSELAQQTLKEIPDQVTGFMKRNKIVPIAPLQTMVLRRDYQQKEKCLAPPVQQLCIPNHYPYQGFAPPIVPQLQTRYNAQQPMPEQQQHAQQPVPLAQHFFGQYTQHPDFAPPTYEQQHQHQFVQQQQYFHHHYQEQQIASRPCDQYAHPMQTHYPVDLQQQFNLHNQSSGQFFSGQNGQQYINH
jgi:hypothetical protein